MRVKQASLLSAAALVLVLAGFDPALARSSIGIGTADTMAPPSGPFAGLFAVVTLYQREFFDALRHALVAMRTEPGGFLYLVGLSFAYGIFHAAGPGHGKAVISSYMVANEVQLRRGVLLSFVSALLQAVSALVVVGLGWYVLRGTGVSMTNATDALEFGSYCLVALFGAVLLTRKLWTIGRRRRLFPAFGLGSGSVPVGAGAGLSAETGRAAMRAPTFRVRHPSLASAPGSAAGGGPAASASGYRFVGNASGGYAAEVCTAEDADACGCGRPHMSDPAALGGRRLSLGTAASVVFSTGLRPCAGAIVVLTFSLLNSLYLGGILSVLAMALGTAITVSALATFAVFAKTLALKASGRGRFGGLVQDGLEIGGALIILLLGLTLVGAVLQGG
ncbi:nickel/cobalt transporter [Aurantimonas sp. VKM B-3413]|uniref:nickel/cobalt transporter n=1 Tax=Aurantimonas sp. VKM B-3413 TaxID=2779401 RepID=UPI001E4C22A8|nr:nickel/cobalt transporter [Aurantimonas sp. VKM B-3413]MCB8838178.1 nickel/cobalt transporter [Aurantimonas sp. VKM B-3413]